MHARTVLRDLRTGVYTSKWWYFDVVQRDVLMLNGRPRRQRLSEWQIVNRQTNSWSAFCYQRCATLAMQHSFFAQRECTDAFLFFA